METDIQVEADLATLARVWLGDMSFDAALHSKGVRLIGPHRLTSAFPTWLMLSHYAGVPRPQAPAATAISQRRAGATMATTAPRNP